MKGRPGSLEDSVPDADSGCGACAAENPYFAAGERWLLAGALTVDTAASVLESSRKARLPATGIVDLTGLEHVDSAAVAVLLAWQRRAALENVGLSLQGAPANLAALAAVYGVEELVGRPARTVA